ncbi:MAG: hypothetical protein CL858_24875 [Cupriavidus sp.]|nr:hypothetical protein [Cupriavidus sp.]
MISRKLLQENESLRQVALRQRLNRLLFDVLSARYAGVPAVYGFVDRCRLENAVYDRFGVSLDSLHLLTGKGAGLDHYVCS